MIQDEIKMMTDIIINEYHPDKIILFGSCARGENHSGSDIDLLVVSNRENHLPRYKRGIDIRRKLSNIKSPFDILFYTHEELNHYKNIQQSFSAALLRDGKVLYG